LSRAFWTYAILYGTALHMAFTAVALIAFTTDAPGWLAACLFFAPTLFSIIAVIGVWRSARHFPGNHLWADLAKMAAVGWAVIWTAI
jgi:hypothetical protein